jgi:cobyrinic acid a,c-diamide synthase
MNGEADCASACMPRRKADLILIEGVMGLFDGTPSAADLAQRFGVPVLAVVDASAMAGTFGALALACSTTAPACPGRGAGQPRGQRAPCAMLRDGLRDSADWLGALAREPWRCGRQQTGRCCPSATWAWWPRTSWPMRPAPGRRGRCAAATPLGQMTAQDLQRWAVDFPRLTTRRLCPPAGGPHRGRGA